MCGSTDLTLPPFLGYCSAHSKWEPPLSFAERQGSERRGCRKMMPATTVSHSDFVSFLMPMKNPTALFHFWTKPMKGWHSSPHTTMVKTTSMNTALAAKKVSGASPPEPSRAMGALLVWLCCSSKARGVCKGHVSPLTLAARNSLVLLHRTTQQRNHTCFALM